MADSPGSDLVIRLGDLKNVDRGTPEDGDALIFDGATNKWMPGRVGGEGQADRFELSVLTYSGVMLSGIHVFDVRQTWLQTSDTARIVGGQDVFLSFGPHAYDLNLDAAPAKINHLGLSLTKVADDTGTLITPGPGHGPFTIYWNSPEEQGYTESLSDFYVTGWTSSQIDNAEFTFTDDLEFAGGGSHTSAIHVIALGLYMIEANVGLWTP